MLSGIITKGVGLDNGQTCSQLGRRLDSRSPEGGMTTGPGFVLPTELWGCRDF